MARDIVIKPERGTSNNPTIEFHGLNAHIHNFITQDDGSVLMTKTGDSNRVVYQSPLPASTSATRGAPLMSDGTQAFWAYPRTDPVGLDTSASYLNRSIFTHGYLAGGYKGSNPWRALNKTWHATDITFYCGDQLDAPMAYGDGTFSDYNGYVHGCVASFTGSSARTSSYNLHTGISRTNGDSGFSSSGLTFPYTGQNPASEGLSYGTAGYANHVGGWNMPRASDLGGCFSGIETQVGYEFGSGSTVGKLHFPTEVMYSITGANSSSDHYSGSEGENYGFIAAANVRHRMAFSSDTFSAVSSPFNTHGICKQLSSKHGKNYSGTGVNVTSGFCTFNNETGVIITSYSKLAAWGEENYEMGQDWGYMLGNFNGQQNNMTWKYTYSTDAQVAMGFSTQPKGHFGQSSGACSSAAATVTVNQQQ